MTLRFLGPTPTPGSPIVAAAVREAADGRLPTRSAIAGAGAFPPRRPAANALARARPTASTSSPPSPPASTTRSPVVGWERERRPFRAHLTLARADGVRAGPATAAALRAAAADLAIESAIDRIVLYESVTGGGPARYVPLEEAPLGAPADGAAGHSEAAAPPGTEAAATPGD